MADNKNKEFWEAMESYKNIVKHLTDAHGSNDFRHKDFTDMFGLNDIEAKGMLDILIGLCFLKFSQGQSAYKVVATKEERLELCKKRIQGLKDLNTQIVEESLRIKEIMELDLGYRE